MQEDASMFRYELSVVAILKNEAPYIAEWINYHLLAGVDHFYLYDNDSSDGLADVLKSYIDNGVVDLEPVPGKVAQMYVYNRAVAQHKFESRYLAFIDADEFIFPKGDRSIKDVLHETLDDKIGAAALAINMYLFGSSGHEKADLTQPVLQRFKYRTPDKFGVERTFDNVHVKVVASPRCIDYMSIPHYAYYYPGVIAVDSNGKHVPTYFNRDVPGDKIIINHYSIKSREEYAIKVKRGNADFAHNLYKMERFDEIDSASTVFDDAILSYQQSRYQNFSVLNGGGVDAR